jgi:hypothetical protein
MDFYFLAQLAEERRGEKRTAAFLHVCFVLFVLAMRVKEHKKSTTKTQAHLPAAR